MRRESDEQSMEDGMDADVKTPLRTAAIMAKVVKVPDVFDDPEGLLALVDSRAPFNLIYGKQGYEKAGGAEPWFRDYWVSDGEVEVAGAERYFNNQKLIDGAKNAFAATVIRPTSMLWNITGPMQAGRPHFDTSPYRGLDNSWPFWLHVVVHNSQLFIPWAAPSTTGLVLFYRGRNGGFECWPDGPDKPSRQEPPPFWNLGLVTDNEFMFHRPMAIGEPHERIAPGGFGGEARLHRHPDGRRWQIVDDTGVQATWAPETVRYSLVWKALAFKDEAAAAVYDNHSDDLTLDLVWQVFADDLREQGSKLKVPKDPMGDRAFRAELMTAYPNPGSRHFDEARRGGLGG
jgi:hypothetical protein